MSVCNADPWQIKSNTNHLEDSEEDKSFEDNFIQSEAENSHNSQSICNNNNDQEGICTRPHEPLPDSANYLQLLERKLAKVQKGTKLLESLQEKRQDCMRMLLASDGVPATTLDQLIELDTPVESGRLHRHLLPIQAVTVGETVHIVKHDALQTESEEDEEEEQRVEDN